MFRFKRRTENPEPAPVDLSPPDTLGRFRESAAWWASGGNSGARDTVMAACDLLVEGFDSPALRDLASLSPDAGWLDSRDIVEAACVGLQVDFVDRDSDDARLLALRALCRSFLRGELAEHSFVRTASALFDFGAPDVAADLVSLENMYEYPPFGQRRSALSALANNYARVYLAAVSTGSTTEPTTHSAVGAGVAEEARNGLFS